LQPSKIDGLWGVQVTFGKFLGFSEAYFGRPLEKMEKFNGTKKWDSKVICHNFSKIQSLIIILALTKSQMI